MNFRFTRKKTILCLIVLVIVTLISSWNLTHPCVCWITKSSDCVCPLMWELPFLIESFILFGLPAGIILYIIWSLIQSKPKAKSRGRKK